MQQIDTVTLKYPVLRGETEISEIEVRKPNVLALKGLKLLDLYQSDVDAMITLLPRITSPMLTKADITKMDSSDFSKLAMATMGLIGGDLADEETTGKSD